MEVKMKFGRMNYLFLGIILMAVAVSCDEENTAEPDEVKYKKYIYEHFAGEAGWIGEFADRPKGSKEFYQLEYGRATLPLPLDTTEYALRQSGSNHSDDLFMFIKREIVNLEPNTLYRVNLKITAATDAPEGSVGIGGSPAGSVYIKAGAVSEEPKTVLDDDDYYRMNIDKGNQAAGGKDMRVIGDFSNGLDIFQYNLKTISNDEPFEVKSDSSGKVWVIIGTDSGFEGITTIYYDRIEIDLEIAE